MVGKRPSTCPLPVPRGLDINVNRRPGYHFNEWITVAGQHRILTGFATCVVETNRSTRRIEKASWTSGAVLLPLLEEPFGLEEDALQSAHGLG